jgi:hexosaminidase
MPNKLILSAFAVMALSLSACKQQTSPEEQAKLAFENLIPKPVQSTSQEGFFPINDSTQIAFNRSDTALQRLATYLADMMQPAAGFTLKSTDSEVGSNVISLQLSSDSTLQAEGYRMQVTPEKISIKAFKPAGIFYAIQTLRQLLPPQLETGAKQTGPWLVAACNIEDKPEYAWRGSMLDVARHFFGVDDVKRYIDLMSHYKMNVLHLHLSDDQGWRIEIKKWPKLAEYGGSTSVNGENPGYYTQEQFKELVKYAADRFIMIVPEIDMPGHTNAALASYPELNCNPKDTAPKLYTGIEVGFSTFCTTNEKVYSFIDDVVAEIAAISPSPYFHIGGDESHVTPKDKYIQFINRVQGIVAKHGKQVIGWDEIANATLQPNTLAQYWSDTLNPGKAVQQGAKIIMSPATKAYMDMQYDSTTRLGLNWAAFIEVDSGYNWDPATMAKGVTRQDVVGIEAPLWTETIKTMDDIEYMVFPRLLGYAEIGWSAPKDRSWETYKKRLAFHGPYMKAKNINFYASKLVPWQQ